ncbi:unnamed protein product [Rhodiola kirilowii]
MAKKISTTTTLYAVLTLAMLLTSHIALVAEAAGCDPSELASCIDALTSNAKPSGQCCSNMKKQGPTCLCSYKNNPAFGPYISNPNARRVVAACKVAYPKC